MFLPSVGQVWMQLNGVDVWLATVLLEVRIMKDLDEECCELTEVILESHMTSRAILCIHTLKKCWTHSHCVNGYTEQLILIMVAVFMQDVDANTRRDITLKCLILKMGESVEDQIKQFLVRHDYCPSRFDKSITFLI